MAAAPSPLLRARVERSASSTGVRVIDALVTLGEGQRIGLFSGSGVGKSSLLGQIARQADADVFVVVPGRRARPRAARVPRRCARRRAARAAWSCARRATRRRSCASSRAYVATAIAEGFRDQGKRVLLLIDSVTRFARALREVGLAAGEAPARRGYPPSVFAALPQLVERAGIGERGSITAVYTVLVEGDDLDEPIADEVRGVLDGHIVLSRELASRGHYPAIDVPRACRA